MAGSAGILRPDDSVEGSYDARGHPEDAPHVNDAAVSISTVPWGRSLKQWSRSGGLVGNATAGREEAKHKVVGTRVADKLVPVGETLSGRVICEAGFFRPEAEPHKVYRSYGEWWMAMQKVDRLKASAHENSDQYWPFGDQVKTVEGRTDYHDFYMLDKRKVECSQPRKTFDKSQDGRFSTGPLRQSARQSYMVPAYVSEGTT